MYQIIAPSLFQNKICRLPGIGTLTMITSPARHDFTNSRILAPTEAVEFIPEYNEENTFNEFSAMSELIKNKLDESGSVFLKGLGTLIRNDDGKISFEALQIDPVFFQPVYAERIIRENAEHALLVGDQETTNFQMTEFFNEKPLLKSRWKLLAIILGAVGICLLMIYLYKNGFNAMGNVRPM
jgi:hypothetical protein